ncbi:MAG: dual specificity protein phosphatase family protein [Anaerolineaceae bacterium]|nr:dual specificity protein phosphatase family protein [Anaerolineaceae bacterium]
MPEYTRIPLRLHLLRNWGRIIEKISGIPRMQFVKVTPQLFVGGQFRQAGKKVLMQHGVTASVNMRIEFDDREHGLDFPDHCYFPTVNDAAPEMEDLIIGAEAIAGFIQNGGIVYVHCAGGLGRAPTMAAAYLISQGYCLKDAEELIKQTRPYIGIQTVQMERLKEFESRY